VVLLYTNQLARKHEFARFKENFNDDEPDPHRKHDETATVRRYVRRLFYRRFGNVTLRYLERQTRTKSGVLR
jgi:hypothetical protein